MIGNDKRIQKEIEDKSKTNNSETVAQNKKQSLKI